MIGIPAGQLPESLKPASVVPGEKYVIGVNFRQDTTSGSILAKRPGRSFQDFYDISSKFINIELHMHTSVSKSFPKRMMPP